MIIMVLNDGETYSEISGCKIVRVPDNAEPDDIENILSGLRDRDQKFREDHVVTEFQ